MEPVDISLDLSNSSDQDLMFLEDAEDEGEGDDGDENPAVKERSNPAQATKRTTVMVCK